MVRVPAVEKHWRRLNEVKPQFTSEIQNLERETLFFVVKLAIKVYLVRI